MSDRRRMWVRRGAVAGGALGAAFAAAWLVVEGPSVVAAFRENRACCQMPLARNVVVAFAEASGRAAYFGEVGQDKWVLETVFPGVTRGYFLDVGSGHGTIGSNSLALERRGWNGICVDPFPVHMEGRTCRLFQEVVFSHAGQRMLFHTAGGLGGLSQTLGHWNRDGARAPVVELTTVTLKNLLQRAQVPAFIHFVSIDIEGAELEALKGFPFDDVRVGAFAIEHNREEPKRAHIRDLLGRHGYVRSHSYRQDDFYVPAPAPRSSSSRFRWRSSRQSRSVLR